MEDVHFLEQNRLFRYILIFNKLRKRHRSSSFGKCGKLSVPLLIKLQLYRICCGERACSQSQSKGGVGGFSDVIYNFLFLSNTREGSGLSLHCK